MKRIDDDFVKNLTIHKNDIDLWFQKEYQHVTPCFYSSVDLRKSDYKIAPVDTNLFPAGFNNLSENSSIKASEQVRLYLDNYYPGTTKILIYSEFHTRNKFYASNLIMLQKIFHQANCEVMFASSNHEQLEIEATDGSKLTLEVIERKNDTVQVNGYIPELIISNNDFTSGVPAILTDIAQKIIPSTSLGWHRRLKSQHFHNYDMVVEKFTNKFNFIDPFLISALYDKCGEINFKEKEGLECIAIKVEKLLHKLRNKYSEYGIKDEPYIFVKADNGTYGMGIITVRSGDEIYELNKKNRNKMDVIKSGTTTSNVIIQEGIKTSLKVEGNVAEPMIYLMNGNPVGYIYRVNTELDEYGNLNSNGMIFKKNICQDIAREECGLFSLIARLASLAASWEE